jgi:hypothetical protein
MPGGLAQRARAALRNRLFRGTLLRRTGRLLEEAEGGRGRGQKAELASAAGPLHALCARDAWDARERQGAAAGVRR